jgi:hypothetical protein
MHVRAARATVAGARDDDGSIEEHATDHRRSAAMPQIEPDALTRDNGSR